MKDPAFKRQQTIADQDARYLIETALNSDYEAFAQRISERFHGPEPVPAIILIIWEIAHYAAGAETAARSRLEAIQDQTIEAMEQQLADDHDDDQEDCS